MTPVVVAGALANKPGSAGEAWVRMSWVRGLQQLGLETWFVEEIPAPDAEDESKVAWFRGVTEAFGLGDRALLLSEGVALAGEPVLGRLREAAPDCALVNISGHLAGTDLFAAFRSRIMVDIDPGFTQFWHAQGLPGARVEGHDLHFTIGELIGTPECSIPTGGIEWLHVRQPVVLSDWPPAEAEPVSGFTTVGTWRGPFGPIEWEGRTYGLKVHEFRKFVELPQRSPHEFELALDIHPADSDDLAALRGHGWRLVDPHRVAGDPDAFRAYVRRSAAEFSVAQGVYVETRSGWFSDRTTRYLASSRPALVQDTGFSSTLPTGDGLLPFRTLAEAAAGARDIHDRYEEHSRAARAIAEEHFDARGVLSRFCEEAGLA